MGMMEACHGPDYDLHQLFCDPCDVGHAACARRRTYVIGSHVERTSMLHDPWEIQEAMKRYITNKFVTHPSDYLISSKTEVELEAQEKARVRNIPYQPGQSDLTYLLTEREKVALADYQLKFWSRVGHMPDEDLFVFLGDDPSYSLTWSFHGKLPTYRMNSRSALLWNCKYKRWLTGKERLCSLGWPVLQSIAGKMGCPVIPSLDVKRAADLAGNSMHLLNTGVMQTIALSAFGPSGTSVALMDLQ